MSQPEIELRKGTDIMGWAELFTVKPTYRSPNIYS